MGMEEVRELLLIIISSNNSTNLNFLNKINNKEDQVILVLRQSLDLYPHQQE